MKQTLFKDSDNSETLTRLIIISFISKYPMWKERIKITDNKEKDDRIIRSLSNALKPHIGPLDRKAIKQALQWFMSDANRKFIDYPPEPKTFVKAVAHFSTQKAVESGEKKIVRRRGLKYWNTVHLLANDKPVPNHYAFFQEEAKKDVNMYKTATHKNYLRAGKTEEFCNCNHCQDLRRKQHAK